LWSWDLVISWSCDLQMLSFCDHWISWYHGHVILRCYPLCDHGILWYHGHVIFRCYPLCDHGILWYHGHVMLGCYPPVVLASNHVIVVWSCVILTSSRDLTMSSLCDPRLLWYHHHYVIMGACEVIVMLKSSYLGIVRYNQCTVWSWDAFIWLSRDLMKFLSCDVVIIMRSVHGLATGPVIIRFHRHFK